MKVDALFFMGMGGPDSIEAIEPFLYNIFTDRNIINFHVGSFLQKFIARRIASSRSKKLASEYLAMGHGGASPQSYYNKLIYTKLEKRYEEVTGTPLKVIEANCYYHPFYDEALEALFSLDLNKVIWTSIYPQYSSTTAGSCFNRLGKYYDIASHKSSHNTIIPHWYENKKYNEVIAKNILKAAKTLGKDISECHLLFSAHSVPLSYIKKGDIYPVHIRHQTEILAEMVQPKSYEVSFQSKVGPVKWLGPATANVLDSYKDSETDNIIIVPISFITDHIETLIELDKGLIPPLKAANKNICRAESLNDNDDFIDAFISIINK